ncbi:MAG: hypothetical protein ACU0C9_09090 [Paracoccaceae bacterium]
MTQHAPIDHALIFPGWVPKAAQHYIIHTERGLSIRQLAKVAGCHASTVLRQVRKMETRRDDPLIDELLSRMGRNSYDAEFQSEYCPKGNSPMTKQLRFSTAMPDDPTIEREGRRILRRLCEPTACLAVAKDREKAVVVRESEDGRTIRTAVVDRPIAQAMALKDWINCPAPGRISRYKITSAGRSALKRLLLENDAARAGFAEVAAQFSGQNEQWQEREIQVADAAPRVGLVTITRNHR